MTRWIREEVGPTPLQPRNGSSLTSLGEVAAADWLTYPERYHLFTQTFYQQDGFAITMLVAERDADDRETTWDSPQFRR